MGFDGRITPFDDRGGGLELALLVGNSTGSGEFLGSAAAVVDEARSSGFEVGEEVAGVGSVVPGVNEQTEIGGFGFAGGTVEPDRESLGVASGLVRRDGDGSEEGEELHGRRRRKAAFGSATDKEGQEGNEPEAH